MNTSLPIVRLRALTKFYRAHHLWGKRILALHEVSFDVERGRIVGIVGPNGSGKTTIFKILIGLSCQSGGEARLFGLLPDDPGLYRKIGYVSEETIALNFMRVLDVMRITGGIFGIRGTELEARIHDLMTLCELNEWEKIEVSKLSKGMKRKLAYAQALINSPELLLLDEPFEGMDVLAREKFKGLILKMKDEGKSILLSTHVLPDVVELCDEVVVLLKGSLVRKVSKRELSIPQGYVITIACDGSVNRDPTQLLPFNFSIQDGKLTARVSSQEGLEELILSFEKSGMKIEKISPVTMDLVELFKADRND